MRIIEIMTCRCRRIIALEISLFSNIMHIFEKNNFTATLVHKSNQLHLASAKTENRYHLINFAICETNKYSSPNETTD